LQEEALRLLSR